MNLEEILAQLRNKIAGGPKQLSLNIGEAPGQPSTYSNAKIRYTPPSTGGRMAGAPNILKNIKGIPAVTGQLAKNAAPLYVLLAAAEELTDQSDPVGLNLAEGAGKGLGLLGGFGAGAAMAAPIPIPGARIAGGVLGSLLLSDVGKNLAGGAYRGLNPEGELNYAIKQLEKQKKFQLAADEVNREIALKRARDQQTVNLEAALINAALGR
mgnify:CR=1 FL=1|tara:strand:+ start:2853 stop:3482 length:630 start_codon:yes stop_codon:yes gene_type:complete